MILEVCVDSAQSAIEAQKAGATRLELCSNLVIGGTTPTASLIKQVKQKVDIPVNVLIRPRFGDFCYSDLEFEQIKSEIVEAKQSKADAVVIGILNPDGSLDEIRMKELIKIARPMKVTLHRAFDVSIDPLSAMETAIKLGIDTILTSGQKQTAIEGKELLAELVKKSQGRIQILVGSNVNSTNIKELKNQTKANAFHMSGKKTINSKMTFRESKVSMGLPIMSEYTIWLADQEEIEKAKKELED